MKTDNKNEENELYRDVETDGVTENIASKQTIQTENTKILKKDNGKDDKEILIGKKIEDVKEIEEDFNSLQRRILNKF